MTIRELRISANKSMLKRWDNVFVLSLFETALIFAFAACDILVYTLCDHFRIEYYIRPSKLFSSPMSIFMVIMRVSLVIFALMPEIFLIRRQYIDILAGRDSFETRRYIMYNTRNIHPRATVSGFVPVMLRFFFALPLAVGVYGIYYFGYRQLSASLSTGTLFMFMLSLGFTAVWLGAFFHYSISLSLVKYIMALNPRANVFDACDLSVRLMEGNHIRYIRTVLSFVPYLPLLVLVYPIFLFVPFYRLTMMSLAREIMGDYWQDKLPAMIKRWNKYAR